MIHALRLPAPLQYPHVQGTSDPHPSQAAAQASKTRPKQGLPKLASVQMVDQQLLVMQRKKLVLVGMDLRCHLIDMFV
jgi:hypothetical protein